MSEIAQNRINGRMAQMNISIPDKLKGWAERRVAEGRYSSTSDYVRDLIRRDQEREEQAARLQAAVDEGLASGVSERTGRGIDGEGRARLELTESLRLLWQQGIESGTPVEANFDAGDVARRGHAQLAAARNGG